MFAVYNLDKTVKYGTFESVNEAVSFIFTNLNPQAVKVVNELTEAVVSTPSMLYE